MSTSDYIKIKQYDYCILRFGGSFLINSIISIMPSLFLIFVSNEHVVILILKIVLLLFILPTIYIIVFVWMSMDIKLVFPKDSDNSTSGYIAISKCLQSIDIPVDRIDFAKTDIAITITNPVCGMTRLYIKSTTTTHKSMQVSEKYFITMTTRNYSMIIKRRLLQLLQKSNEIISSSHIEEEEEEDLEKEEEIEKEESKV